MPKKILFESAVHQFLNAARNVADECPERPETERERWHAFVASLRFEHRPNGVMQVRWTSPQTGCALVSYRDASFYVRGDTTAHVHSQKQQGLVFSRDDVMRRNQRLFAERVREVAASAGLHVTVAR